MTTAPPEDQLRLLDVQALDTAAAQLAHRRRTLPVHAELAELGSRLEDVRTALVTSRTAAEDLRRELTKAEADVEQVRNRAARDQSRLDSGQGSAKDLQALQSELASLARRQGELEEIELDVMERLEAHEKALGELEEAERALLEQQQDAVRRRDEELGVLDADTARLAEQRAVAVTGIDTGLIDLYEKIRERSGGLGAAALRARRCEGCRLELNATDLKTIRAAAPEQVVRCEECGRILVRVPDSGL